MATLISEQERRLERRTQALLDHLARTERRAEELKRETERLRRIKDEAKELVARKHPELFGREYDDDGPEESLSEGHPTTFLSRDLLEIRQLLGEGRRRERRGSSNSAVNSLDRHMANIRREAGVGSSRHSNDPVNAAVGAPTLAWPADCVPVPIETLKRMMAQAATANATATGQPTVIQPASTAPPLESPMPPLHLPEVALPSSFPHIPSAPSPARSNDDTSNDAADLSQEHQAADVKTIITRVKGQTPTPQQQRGTVAKELKLPKPVPAAHEIAHPQPSPAPRSSKVTTKVDIHRNEGYQEPLAIPSVTVAPISNEREEPSGEAAAVAESRATTSSDEPDENFVIPSDRDEKLYSSETTDSKKGGESESEEEKPPQVGASKKANNPLAKLAEKLTASQAKSGGALKVESDSDSRQEVTPAAPAAVIESGLSDELEDDDFWN